jgi:hypothetical protein
MVLRLFHSGAGTFWTNMEGKNMNLMFPAPTGDKERLPPPANKEGEPDGASKNGGGG